MVTAIHDKANTGKYTLLHYKSVLNYRKLCEYDKSTSHFYD